MRRTGWLALTGVGAAFFALTALGGTYAVGLALADGAWLDALGGGGFTVLTLVFWKWITLGAWIRANPPDPEDPAAADRPAPEPIGPWGIVGQVLMVLVVAGFVAVVVAATVSDRSATDAAEEVRDDALRAARRAQLSVEAVEQARSADASPPEQRAGAAVADLLDVPDARVVDSSVDDGRAALLIRPDAGAPCVVVSVDANGILSSALTDDC
jgi:hypothetical protein